MASQEAKEEKRAEQYLKQMQLWEKRKTNARSLSGMKRRLMVARALVNRPAPPA